MQGTVVRWDPETAENIVRIRGADHANVPLIDLGLGQRAMLPGDQVAIMSWSPNGGSAAYFILGRLVVPGEQATQRSIEVLATLARQLIGAAIDSESAPGQTSTSSTSFGDGSVAGPTISDIEITATGRCLVWLAAQVDAGPITDAGQIGGWMSFQVSGASSVSPSPMRAVSVHQSVLVTGATGWSHRAGVTAGNTVLLTGLNAGTHTFQAKYASQVSGETVRFSERLLTVMAL